LSFQILTMSCSFGLHISCAPRGDEFRFGVSLAEGETPRPWVRGKQCQLGHQPAWVAVKSESSEYFSGDPFNRHPSRKSRPIIALDLLECRSRFTASSISSSKSLNSARPPPSPSNPHLTTHLTRRKSVQSRSSAFGAQGIDRSASYSSAV